MLLAVFHEYACAMNGSAGAEALNREEILSFAQFNLFFHFFFKWSLLGNGLLDTMG